MSTGGTLQDMGFFVTSKLVMLVNRADITFRPPDRDYVFHTVFLGFKHLLKLWVSGRKMNHQAFSPKLTLSPYWRAFNGWIIQRKRVLMK
jgi:hypothetical protein